jgi:hypothetical protein
VLHANPKSIPQGFENLDSFKLQLDLFSLNKKLIALLTVPHLLLLSLRSTAYVFLFLQQSVIQSFTQSLKSIIRVNLSLIVTIRFLHSLLGQHFQVLTIG